eukprot:1333726-Amorphochlora_amoeboformis.AAC.2
MNSNSTPSLLGYPGICGSLGEPKGEHYRGNANITYELTLAKFNARNPSKSKEDKAISIIGKVKRLISESRLAK